MAMIGGTTKWIDRPMKKLKRVLRKEKQNNVSLFFASSIIHVKSIYIY